MLLLEMCHSNPSECIMSFYPRNVYYRKAVVEAMSNESCVTNMTVKVNLGKDWRRCTNSQLYLKSHWTIVGFDYPDVPFDLSRVVGNEVSAAFCATAAELKDRFQYEKTIHFILDYRLMDKGGCLCQSYNEVSSVFEDKGDTPSAQCSETHNGLTSLIVPQAPLQWLRSEGVYLATLNNSNLGNLSLSATVTVHLSQYNVSISSVAGIGIVQYPVNLPRRVPIPIGDQTKQPHELVLIKVRRGRVPESDPLFGVGNNTCSAVTDAIRAKLASQFCGIPATVEYSGELEVQLSVLNKRTGATKSNVLKYPLSGSYWFVPTTTTTTTTRTTTRISSTPHTTQTTDAINIRETSNATTTTNATTSGGYTTESASTVGQNQVSS